MARVALAVMLLAGCSDPATVPDAGGEPDALLVDELVVSPGGFDFGDYKVGSIDPRVRTTFEVANRGTGAATLTSIALSGPAAADFSIAANDCGAMLAPAETCSVRIEFAATTAGTRDATLEVTGSSSATAVLSGNGIAPPARIRFTPGSRNFGDIAATTTGAPFTFTVKNEDGPTTLTASIVGTGAEAFRITSTDCTTGVFALGATCSVSVELVPPYDGQFTADVVLLKPNGSKAQAGLSGASTTPLSLGPYAGQFGWYLIGQPDPGQRVTFTLTNTGTTASGPISATTVGPAAADFTVRSTTCTTLAPAASCDVVVELTPLTRGAKIAQLSVTDSVAEARVALRGNAYTVLVTGAAFPNTVSGQQSAIQSFAVINPSGLATGPVTVVRGGADASQFTVVSTTCAAGIPANNACTIMARFTPTSAGLNSATLDVSASPGGSHSFAISGRGL